MKKQLELQLKQRQLRQAESLESASTQIASPQEESKNLDFAQEDLRRKSLIVRGAITDEIPQQKNTKTFLSTGLSEEFSLLENPESELPEESRLRLWSNPQDSFANEDRVNFDDYYSEDNIPGLFGNSASPINQDDLNDKEIARAIAESIRDMEDRSKFLDQGGIESFYEDLGGPAKRGPVDQGSSNNFLEAQKISDQQYEKGIYREISAGIESHSKSYRDAFPTQISAKVLQSVAVQLNFQLEKISLMMLNLQICMIIQDIKLMDRVGFLVAIQLIYKNHSMKSIDLLNQEEYLKRNTGNC